MGLAISLNKAFSENSSLTIPLIALSLPLSFPFSTGKLVYSNNFSLTKLLVWTAWQTLRQGGIQLCSKTST